MCSRPGDLSLVIPIFWMQESHKGGSTWESWILIGDWEIIGDRSGGQVQCIFIVNFRGHIRVGRVPPVFFFFGGGGAGGWDSNMQCLTPSTDLFFLLLCTYEPKAALPLSSRWPFLMFVKIFCGYNEPGLPFWYIVNLEHPASTDTLDPGCCRNRIFYILPVQLCQGRTRCDLAINSN